MSDCFIVHTTGYSKAPFHVDYLLNSTSNTADLITLPFLTSVKVQPMNKGFEPLMKQVVVRKPGDPDPEAPPKTFLERYWVYGIILLFALMIPVGEEPAGTARRNEHPAN